MIDEKTGTRWSNKPVMVQTDEGLERLRKICSDRGLAYTTVWQRIKKGWEPLVAINTPLLRKTGNRCHHAGGYIKISGDSSSEHVMIAEKAIGKTLPIGAVVHHVNGVKDDNRNENLVICPSHSYHKLLHVRQRAMEETGNPDFRRCEICGEWDSTELMYIRKDKAGQWHRACSSKARIERKRKARQ